MLSRSLTLLLRRDVVEQPVALRARQRDAAGHLVAERTREGALGLDEVIVAVAELEVVLGREARFARRHEDRAGRRVLAEQRALRAAQHLDALDVDEIERRRRGPRVQHAVDVVADAGLDAVVREAERRAEAADVDARVARIRRIELDGRNQLLDAVDVERARFRDQLAVDDGDRNRHFLHGFFAPARAGHRNDVVDLGLRSSARRLRRPRVTTKRERRRCRRPTSWGATSLSLLGSPYAATTVSRASRRNPRGRAVTAVGLSRVAVRSYRGSRRVLRR